MDKTTETAIVMAIVQAVDYDAWKALSSPEDPDEADAVIDDAIRAMRTVLASLKVG